MLALLMIAGATVGRFDVATPRWLSSLPLVWFAWQLAAATHTADAGLTRATLLHFGASVACFYLGLFALSRVKQVIWFWLPVLAAFAWMLWLGFGQHFGGLESTRRLIYEQPNWQQFSPEYLKRMGSDRIFSTLVYPNALAGAILLFLPVLTVVAWQITAGLTNV